MNRKIALFAFNGDPMCFIHVLLNTRDMHDRGCDVRLVIEGSATQLVEPLDKEDHPLHGLFTEVEEKGLIHCVCRACANKMGTLEKAEEMGLPLCGDLAGHPSMGACMEEGYEVIVF